MREVEWTYGYDGIVVARSGWQGHATLGTRARKSLCTGVPLALLALSLSGCALFERKIETRWVTVYCLTPEQFQQLKDAEPERVKSRLTGDADKDVRTLAGSAIRLRAWGEGTLEILGGCVEPKPNAETTAMPDGHELADKILAQSDEVK